MGPLSLFLSLPRDVSSASPYLGPRIDESPPVGLFEKLIDPPPALRGNANGHARLFYRVMRNPSTTLPSLCPLRPMETSPPNDGRGRYLRVFPLSLFRSIAILFFLRAGEYF